MAVRRRLYQIRILELIPMKHTATNQNLGSASVDSTRAITRGDRLSADTQRTIRAILDRGYYNRCETLGEGGWPSIANEIANWKSYWLSAEDSEGNHFDDNITAKNDKIAKVAFSEKYHLADLAFYSIHELTTTNRVIATS